MDTIRYRPKESWFPLSVYWIRSNWNRELFIDCYKIVNLTILAFVNSKSGWFFLKTALSFLLDGWHLVKFFKEMIRSAVIILLVVLLGDVSWYWMFITIALYAYRGIWWELTYGD